MNVPLECYSCGNRTKMVKNECCKMRKLAANVNHKFQDWTDELALAYHGVQSRFTCDGNGRLSCQKIPLIEDLLDVVDVSHAQKIAESIKHQYMITLMYQFKGCFSVSRKLSKNFSKTYNKR